MKTLALISILAFGGNQEASFGRFAVSHDGNHHDKDDIGASAMVQALTWKAGVQGSLVHFDHSSHLGENTPSQHEDMIVSSTRWLWWFGIDQGVVFDDYLDLRNSVLSLAAQIEASSEQDPLTILQAGPWEVMALAFDAADPSTHQYVKIVSHSHWNNTHKSEDHHRNKEDFDDQYEEGGKWEGVTPPDYEKISDQNQYAFNSSINEWTWLAKHPNTAFVLDRTLESSSAAGDMSDAGMLFWLLTGIEKPTMQEVRNFFEL